MIARNRSHRRFPEDDPFAGDPFAPWWLRNPGTRWLFLVGTGIMILGFLIRDLVRWLSQ